MSRFSIPNFRASTAEDALPYFDLVMNKMANSLYLQVKIKDIGTWNMDTTASKVVAFSLGVDIKLITSINVMILNDDLDEIYNFNEGATSIKYDATNGVTLTRTGSGIFDGTDFDSTSNNRGYVTVCHTT